MCVPIRAMESPNAVVAAPFGHELVVGTHKGNLLLLDHAARALEEQEEDSGPIDMSADYC